MEISTTYDDAALLMMEYHLQYSKSLVVICFLLELFVTVGYFPKVSTIAIAGITSTTYVIN